MERLRTASLSTAVLATGLALSLAACTHSAPEPVSGPVKAPETTTDPGAAGPGRASTPGDAAADASAELEMRCNADPVQSLVGQEATETLVAQATAASGSANVRVLGPGDAATMDFRGDRLNILTDDSGIVQSFNCG